MKRACLIFVFLLSVLGCSAENDIVKICFDENVDTVEIEIQPVKSYNQVIYNDNDYSYSLVKNYCCLLGKPYSYLPNGKVVTNPAFEKTSSWVKLYREDTEQCVRTIRISANVGCFEVINLVPNKLYRCESWSDDMQNMIGCDRFYTVGKTRMLKIPAVKYVNDTTLYNKGYDYIYNVRDIGGLRTYDGGFIEYGKVIRGGALGSADGTMTYISEEGKDALTALGITAELDLRTSSQVSSCAGSIVEYKSVSIDQLFYRLNIYHDVRPEIRKMATAIRVLLTWLREGKRVYVHCTGGADRTGVFCTIIEGICGVTENEICHDYEMTSFGELRKRNREYYSIEKGAVYDGDYKYAIAYIKGLLEYCGRIYVKYAGNYYETDKQIPTPIEDSVLIEVLENVPQLSLKEKFRLLMQIGGNGLTVSEMNELEGLLLQSNPPDILTTNMSNVKQNHRKSNIRFDIDGRIQPILKMRKGLFIQNGKKYFHK